MKYFQKLFRVCVCIATALIFALQSLILDMFWHVHPDFGLDLINPDHDVHGRMTYNDSGKHESSFTSVKVHDNKSVMLSSLAGSTLGVWISHGEQRIEKVDFIPESYR